MKDQVDFQSIRQRQGQLPTGDLSLLSTKKHNQFRSKSDAQGCWQWSEQPGPLSKQVPPVVSMQRVRGPDHHISLEKVSPEASKPPSRIKDHQNITVKVPLCTDTDLPGPLDSTKLLAHALLSNKSKISNIL